MEFNVHNEFYSLIKERTIPESYEKRLPGIMRYNDFPLKPDYNNFIDASFEFDNDSFNISEIYAGTISNGQLQLKFDTRNPIPDDRSSIRFKNNIVTAATKNIAEEILKCIRLIEFFVVDAIVQTGVQLYIPVEVYDRILNGIKSGELSCAVQNEVIKSISADFRNFYLDIEDDNAVNDYLSKGCEIVARSLIALKELIEIRTKLEAADMLHQVRISHNKIQELINKDAC